MGSGELKQEAAAAKAPSAGEAKPAAPAGRDEGAKMGCTARNAMPVMSRCATRTTLTSVPFTPAWCHAEASTAPLPDKVRACHLLPS